MPRDPFNDSWPELHSERMNLLDIFAIVSKRRRFVAAATLIVAILTVVIVLLLPNQYTAETLILPPGQNSSGTAMLNSLGSSALLSAAGAGLGIKNPAEMYVALFKTRTVEDAVISRFRLTDRYHTSIMSDARHLLEHRTKTLLDPKSGLIRLSATDHDPAFAAQLANGYVDEFRNQSAHLVITEAAQRRLFFQQQLLDANENLTTAEEAMKSSQDTTGGLQVDSQTRSLIEAAASLRGQIVAKEVEIQSMRSFATEDNPQMVTAEQQLDALKAQLTKLAGTDPKPGSEIIVPKGNLRAASLEYVRKLRDVRYYETIAQLIARQFESAKLDEARQGAVVQVADSAVPPDNHSSPKRSLTVILATFVGFFGAIWWCILGEQFRRMARARSGRTLWDQFRMS